MVRVKEESIRLAFKMENMEKLCFKEILPGVLGSFLLSLSAEHDLTMF